MAEENRSFTDESTNLEPESKNFIENFIDEDLKEGKVRKLKPVSPRNRTAIYILDTQSLFY